MHMYPVRVTVYTMIHTLLGNPPFVSGRRASSFSLAYRLTIRSTLLMSIARPSPICLQATLAALRLKPILQTAPHFPFRNMSNLPNRWEDLYPVSLTSPFCCAATATTQGHGKKCTKVVNTILRQKISGIHLI